MLYGLIDGGLAQDPAFRKSVLLGHDFLDDCQIKENTKDYDTFWRQISKGGFPFSTRDCGRI